MTGKFCWYDLMTEDLDAAQSFYGDVIGWTAKESGLTDKAYRVWSMGPTMIGGLMGIPDEARAEGARPGWVGYIAVDDVDAYAGRVKQEGGSILRAPEDIPGIGRFAVVTDPHGAAFLLFRGATDQSPAPPPAGTPGHIGWHELYAGNNDAAWAFYAKLFGWTKAQAVDMGPMGIYQTFATGGEPVGGMMTKPPQMPRPMWLYYFNVEAANAAAARIARAGGKVLMGPQEVPGGSWIVQGLDPQGAMFAVVARKE